MVRPGLQEHVVAPTMNHGVLSVCSAVSKKFLRYVSERVGLLEETQLGVTVGGSIVHDTIFETIRDVLPVHAAVGSLLSFRMMLAVGEKALMVAPAQSSMMRWLWKDGPVNGIHIGLGVQAKVVGPPS